MGDAIVISILKGTVGGKFKVNYGSIQVEFPLPQRGVAESLFFAVRGREGGEGVHPLRVICQEAISVHVQAFNFVPNVFVVWRV